jgi:diaminopimelate decarboxylase
VYSGTQCLNADAIVENYATFIDIFTRVCAAHGIRPEILVFGSGLGIPYYETDTPLDLATVGAGTVRLLGERLADPAFAATRLVLEIGRHLVGEGGIYLTRIVRTKRSRGVDIGICDGGMNHHLGAAGHLGSVVPRNYRMFKVVTEAASPPERSYNLVGPLCTTIDTLARNVKLGELAAGDLIGIHCSGAYGLSASPIHFISHPPPREVLVDGEGEGARLSEVSQFRPSAAVD